MSVSLRDDSRTVEMGHLTIVQLLLCQTLESTTARDSCLIPIGLFASEVTNTDDMKSVKK